MRGYFVTGTDTDVGKTWVTAGLLHAFNARGQRTIAMKPVASGCDTIDKQLRNADALCLMQHMSEPAEYDEVNPYAFIPAVAPHIVAARVNQAIELESILQTAKHLANRADVILVEGVGGWQVPLNRMQTVADLAVELQLPLIMVVAIKLGCLNHALLTAESIKVRGLPLAGRVANMCYDFDPVTKENIAALQDRLASPLLAEIPCLQAFDVNTIAAHMIPDQLTMMQSW